MRTAAFKWLDLDDRSSLRFNYNVVAWVVWGDGRWTVELHTWRGTISHPVASRATGKRYIERWAEHAGGFWACPYRKHDRRPNRKNPTAHVPGFDEPMSAPRGVQGKDAAACEGKTR